MRKLIVIFVLVATLVTMVSCQAQPKATVKTWEGNVQEERETKSVTMKLSVSYTSGTSASATITVDGTSYSGTIAFTDGICVMGYPSHSHQYGASFYADDNEGTFTSMETFMQTGTIYFSYYEKPFWAAYALNVSN